MRLARGLALAALLWAPAALAQQEWVTDERPVSVEAVGGVEGYTGVLGSKLDRSGNWGVTVGFEPLKFLGVEGGYSGALSCIRGINVIGGTAQLSRNGGYIAARPSFLVRLNPSLNLTLRPYLLAGAGFDSYQATVLINQYFNLSDTSLIGGGGLRLQLGHFVLDVRASYIWDYGSSFTLYDGNPGRWVAQVGLGGAIF